jgi:hypothetical protein
MATGIYSWSQTAATNATADSTINWAEGQAPSTVNDSARAQMAVLSKWRDDISGVAPSNVVLTTGGTANAQTLSTNGSIAALTNGWTITFKAGAGLSNTTACTFAPDSLTAKQIQSVSGTNLSGGEILAGSVYTITYHQPADAWILHSAASNIGMVRLTSNTLTNESALSLDLSAYTGYRCLEFVLSGWRPATDSTGLICRTSTDGGGSYDSGSTDYRYAYHWIFNDSDGTNFFGAADTAADAIHLARDQGNASTESLSAKVTLWAPASTAFHTHISYDVVSQFDTGVNQRFVGGGQRISAANVDGIRFLFETGDIATGSYAVYGIS